MDQLKGPFLYGQAKVLSSGVKDTDQGANSCQIAAPCGDYSMPSAKVRSQLKESGSPSLSSFASFISLGSFFFISFFLFSLPLFLFLLLSSGSLQGITSLKLPEWCLKPFVSCARQKAEDGFQRLKWPLSYGGLSVGPVRADRFKYDAGLAR